MCTISPPDSLGQLMDYTIQRLIEGKNKLIREFLQGYFKSLDKLTEIEFQNCIEVLKKLFKITEEEAINKRSIFFAEFQFLKIFIAKETEFKLLGKGTLERFNKKYPERTLEITDTYLDNLLMWIIQVNEKEKPDDYYKRLYQYHFMNFQLKGMDIFDIEEEQVI